MAKQLFYSRVPSKIAMFYKSNGFDTFACSTGINQDLIDKDLNVILEQKLTSEELGLIRLNELKPVYFHFTTKDGILVEDAISYLNQDYTGERSSYLSHTLIFDSDELKNVHYGLNNKVINDALFMHDLSSFDITSPNAKPIKDYPELKFKGVSLDKPITYLQENFDSTTLKRFLFALIACLCGKYKCVHVVLPTDENFDEGSLLFFNSIINLFPYHVRKAVSYVSRVNDFNKYSGFKLKIISSTLGIAPTSKGVTIDFHNKMIYGIKDNDLKLCGNVPDFLYRLINKEEERLAFFTFIKKACDKLEVLKSLDFKTINELVYLFKTSSNFYEEKQVLPDDDKVLEFLTCYEKYRQALTDEYRMNGMKCLRRYPNNYQAIPKLVFNKITKNYPTEINGTKHIIMNVCLDLIHTDLMRNQLFNFINANYQKEDNETKSQIVINLVNVFYGGFLQEQILDLFSRYFEKFNEENRLLVIDKLLLSIRTEEIQDAIITFFNNKYNVLTIDEKTKIYESTADHLPEGDALAKKLLMFCDEHIINEENALVKIYSKSLCSVLLDEQKRKDQLLLPLVSESNGFTFDTITQVIFTKWRKRKISAEFITLACRGTIIERVNKIVKMWQLVQNEIQDELSKKFIDSVLKGFVDYPCICSIEEVFTAEENLLLGLKRIKKSRTDPFVKKFRSEVISKLLKESLFNVFRSETKGSVEKLIEYSKYNDIIADSDNLNLLENYVELKATVLNGDIPNTIRLTNAISNYKDILKYIGNYLTIELYNDINLKDINELLSTKFILLTLIINYFKTGSLKLGYVYNKIIEQINALFEEYPTSPLDIQKYKCMITKTLIEISLIIENDESLNEKINANVRDEDNGILVSCSDIVLKYGKKQLKALSNVSNDKLELIKYLNEKTKRIKSTAKLFSKVIKL